MALRLACTCAVPETMHLPNLAGRGFAPSRDKCISVEATVKVRTATDRKIWQHDEALHKSLQRRRLLTRLG